MKNIHKAFFRLRAFHEEIQSWRRGFYWRVQGARFGRATPVPPLRMTWPHQVQIGAHCTLEPDIFFKFDGIWSPGPSILIGDDCFVGRGCEFNICQRVSIGDHCLIASGCKFIDHDHGFAPGELMKNQAGEIAPIALADDVWLGVNVTVLKGVRIAQGAIVAAGAVVTKNVGANEIWAGVPARKIGQRPTNAES